MSALIVLTVLLVLCVAVSLYGYVHRSPHPPEPTFAEQVTELTRQVDLVAVTIGEQMTPAIQQVAEAFADFGRALQPPVEE